MKHSAQIMSSCSTGFPHSHLHCATVQMLLTNRNLYWLIFCNNISLLQPEIPLSKSKRKIVYSKKKERESFFSLPLPFFQTLSAGKAVNERITLLNLLLRRLHNITQNPLVTVRTQPHNHRQIVVAHSVRQVNLERPLSTAQRQLVAQRGVEILSANDSLVRDIRANPSGNQSNIARLNEILGKILLRHFSFKLSAAAISATSKDYFKKIITQIKKLKKVVTAQFYTKKTLRAAPFRKRPFFIPLLLTCAFFLALPSSLPPF